MKPKNYSSIRSNATRCLTALTFVFTASFAHLHAATWTNTGAPGVYSWLDPLNWDTALTGPSGIDASALLSANITSTPTAVQGTQSISLNSPVILGNLAMGDLNSAIGNGFFNIQNGTGGSLTFQTSTGNAQLTRTITAPGTPPTTPPSYSGTTDTISATVILASSLDADIRGGTVNISGLVSGAGTITRSGSISQFNPPTTGGGNLGLSNNNNSYTGDTIIEHGTLNLTLNGNVGVSANSVIGNAASDVFLGTSATVIGANGTSVLNFVAGSDSGNYQMSRGIDLSGSSNLTTANATVNFNGNGAGAANTNTLTMAGPMTFGSRNAVIAAVRGGMTLNITGDITGSVGSIRWNTFPPDPGNPNVDGRGAGTVRFSNFPRSYTNANSFSMGTVIIDGDVPATGSSPIGTTTIGLSVGTGGNIVGGGNFSAGAAANRDTSPDSVRSLFLATPGTAYARTLTPGNGTISTAGAGTAGQNFLPASYGTNPAINTVGVINGFQLGGINTTGTVTFSGPISSGNPTVGSCPTNVITTAVNLALISHTGGAVEFTNVINDTSNVATNTRITINQLRNHPNLDGNNGVVPGAILADGLPDPAANTLVGTANGGTVILSGSNTYEGGTEVLGGTLKVNNTAGSGTGTGNVKVVSGAKLGGSGTISGSATLDDGAGLAFTVNTVVSGHNSFDITTNLTLLGTTAVTILDGIGAEIGTYTLATVGGTFSGTPLVNPILPAGMTGTVSVVGNELRLNVTGVVSADYIAWIGGYPSITGANQAINADPDGDGASNQQEYAFGLIPDSGASSNPIVVPLDKTTGKFTYTRRTLGLPDPDLVYTVQTSTTLAGWANDAGASQLVTGTVGDVQTVEVTLSGTKPLTAPALFIRVIAE